MELLLTKLDLLCTPNFKRLSGLRITERRAKFALEQVTGFEPVSSAWQAEILTIILYLHIGVRRLCNLLVVTTLEFLVYS